MSKKTSTSNPTCSNEKTGVTNSPSLWLETATSLSGISLQETFPVKLHHCISNLERAGMGHIASFQPHGRCLMVRKQKEFVELVLPCWFNQTKYSSFQRQLNLYGFQRITRGPDECGYFHCHFLRGKPALSRLINRVAIKGKGPFRPSATTALPEPNFYAMPFLRHDHQRERTNKTQKADTTAAKHHSWQRTTSAAPKSQAQLTMTSNHRVRQSQEMLLVGNFPFRNDRESQPGAGLTPFNGIAGRTVLYNPPHLYVDSQGINRDSSATLASPSVNCAPTYFMQRLQEQQLHAQQKLQLQRYVLSEIMTNERPMLVHNPVVDDVVHALVREWLRQSPLRTSGNYFLTLNERRAFVLSDQQPHEPALPGIMW